jgi:hypothetical protein
MENLLALAMPLVSLPMQNLINTTIDNSNLTETKKKKLKELYENAVKIAPITSHILIQKDDVKLMLYLDIDENYNTSAELNNIPDVFKTDIKRIMEESGKLLHLVNVYFDGIKQRVPDVFKKIKAELNIPDDPQGLPNNSDDVLEGIFIDDLRRMYIDYRCPKKLVLKFKIE